MAHYITLAVRPAEYALYLGAAWIVMTDPLRHFGTHDQEHPRRGRKIWSRRILQAVPTCAGVEWFVALYRRLHKRQGDDYLGRQSGTKSSDLFCSSDRIADHWALFDDAIRPYSFQQCFQAGMTVVALKKRSAKRDSIKADSGLHCARF